MSALVDTNVLIAAVIPGHEHAEASARLFATGERWLVAAHSLSEFQNVITRPNRFDWPPLRAFAALETLIARTEVGTLTVDQHVAAIAQFASRGGIGARLYDWLIGQVALTMSASAIITWNASDFRPLFPALDILTPAQYLEAH